MSSQLPLFIPESDWEPPSLSDLPTDWGDGRVGIDTETRDDLLKKLGPGPRRGGYIVGISLAFEGGKSFYLPIRHGAGGNMDARAVINYMRSCAARFTGTLCGANLSYDLDFLAEAGIEFKSVHRFRDVQIADPLICELHDSYSLQAVSERWGFEGKDEHLMDQALEAHNYRGSSAKSGIWALHSKFVGPYAERDAELPLAILRLQEEEIKRQGLEEIYDLESRVLPCLVNMRRRGVRVSEDRLDQVSSWALEQQREAIRAANELIVKPLDVYDITKTARVADALISLGVSLPKTKTGKYSVTSDILDRIDHPVGVHLRRAKKMSTLRTTFVDGVRKHLTGGRAHCSFNQMRRSKDDGTGEEGAAFGRLSSSNFNFQNQPARDPEIGPLWRSIYVPDEGGEWASLDYSQQEPRQAVHFAVKTGPQLLGDAAHAAAVEAARRYREDPNTDFHQMMADMAGIERKPAKNIFLGLSYGMGGAKLCRDLGLPTVWRLSWKEGRKWRNHDFDDAEEARKRARMGRQAGYNTRMYEAAGPEGQDLMDTFDERVPFVRRMAKLCERRAESVGHINTLLGRKCRFPEMANGQIDNAHKGFNRLIQGSSADQTKAAVVAMEDAGYQLQLQVHDEVDMTVADRGEAERAAVIMENVVELEVPMRVDVETGPSWGEIT